MSRDAVGWHGKLPTVSDFASRRLDARFIDLWDSRLSAALGRMRVQDEGGWVETYLLSPTWRFLITRGFLPPPFGGSAWAGVLMPSVDRVGRYYPLTLVSPLAAIPGSPDGQSRLWRWLQQLEDAAVSALQQDWSIDELEARLFGLGSASGFQAAELATTSDPEPPDWALTPGIAEFFGVDPSGGVLAGCSCSCVWYSQVDIDAPKVLHATSFDQAFSGLWSS